MHDLFSSRTLKLASLGVAGFSLAASAAGQFTSQNVTLRSQVLPSQVGADEGSSCWGYTSPSGREYALMGYNDRLSVIEVTNPASPVVVGSITHSASLWCEVKAYQGYAYVSNETGGGLDIINLTQVDSGIVTLQQRFTGGGLSTAHTVTIDEASGFLYLNGANLNGGRIICYSLANPASPVFVGQISSAIGTYCHDSQVVTYTSGPNAGRQIAFSCEGSTGLAIYDVTNKAAITRLSRTTYPSLSYCHQGWLTANSQYFYVNDELDNLPQTRVFDVSNLAAPSMVTTFFIGENTIDHNLFIRDGFIFEANYTCGLQIFDALADPLNPPRVGYFDTRPEDNGATFNAAWNNYPYFTNNKVIISDIERGMFVVDVSRALNYLTFTFPNGLPATVSPSGGTTVRVNVAGRLASPQANSGQLHYNAGAGFVTVPMTAVSSTEYDAVFPALPCGSTVSYYFSANNTLGDTYNSPGDAPTVVYSAPVASNVTLQLNETFETNTGWTAGMAGDTATTGVWTRVNPNGTTAQPEDDHSNPGTICWVTGQGTIGGGIGDADVDGGRTTLLSPAFNLAAYQEAIISYWRWYSNGLGGDPNNDVFRVEISNNNGSTWTSLETVGPAGPGTSGGWIYHEATVSGIVPLTSQVRVRFIAEDAGTGSVIEAALDDFQIRELECAAAPCPPDLNGDGVVDLTDLTLLLANFGCVGPSCTGDLDGDSDTDLSDLTGLLSAFGTNCP